MTDTIQPSNETTVPDTSTWPLLLKGYSNLICKTALYSPYPAGNSPLKRPLRDHLKYGVINLDKPSNPSSHEIVSWVKRILKVEKTGHSGTLDPKVTGCLIICIDRATRIAKSQQNAGKEYVSVLKLFKSVSYEELKKSVQFLTGKLYQCPPAISAVKKVLRVRQVYSNDLIEFDSEKNLAVLRIACEAGTYVRTLCEHLGLVLGVGGEMAELRRTRSGYTKEEVGLVTMHDVLDAKFMLDRDGDEKYLRRVIRPLEWMLKEMKRVVVKDSSVDAICHGAKVLVPGVMRFDPEIETNDEVVIISTKGEAVALGIAMMTANQILTIDHGVACKIKRVIMDRGTYPKCWSTGPVAMEKKRLIKQGLLTEKGKPNDKTPPNWLKSFLERKIDE